MNDTTYRFGGLASDRLLILVTQLLRRGSLSTDETHDLGVVELPEEGGW